MRRLSPILPFQKKSHGQNENAVREGGAANALEWCGIWKYMYSRGIQELRKRVSTKADVRL